MTRPPVWIRIRRRVGREVASRRHARFDRALLQRAESELSEEETARLAARMTRTPRGGEERGLLFAQLPASRKEAWRQELPGSFESALRAAQEALADRVTLFDVPFPLDDSAAWHRDLGAWRRELGAGRRNPSAQNGEPLSGPDDRIHRPPSPAARSARWPLRPHSRVTLSGPRAPGDARLQWEPARFQHVLLLGRAYLASGDPVYADAFRRQVDAFMAGNPPFDGVHWTVGMEVAIRAAAWLFALEFLRGAAPLAGEWSRRMVRHLLHHGLYLETHIERHPLGFTTNHTVCDYAGLAVLGRAFSGTAAGERWRGLAAEGLAGCLAEQVLPGGAHAEGSLPYERLVLEACLVAALCLDRQQAAPLRAGVQALARHLRAATLASGLPFVGDGDDSQFPPFAWAPFDDWDPLDPEGVLQVAAAWCGDPSLRRRRRVEEAAFWFGGAARTSTPASPPAASAGPPIEPLIRGGCLRFTAGPFTGLLIARESSERWLATHEHNDLLSLVLEVQGIPFLIDPGTGVYGLDPNLRHALRSTAAHSTLQLDDLEQSPLDAQRPFEGPPSVPCGVRALGPIEKPAGVGMGGGAGGGVTDRGAGAEGRGPDVAADHASQAAAVPGGGLAIEAWHDGFGGGFRHVRRVSWVGGSLWIEDGLDELPTGASPAASVPLPPGGAKGASPGPPGPPASSAPPASHVSHLRFRGAPGLTLLGVEPASPVPGLALPPGLGESLEASNLQGDVSASRVRIGVAGGNLEFLLLRPEKALWQIGSGATSRRYGRWQEAPVIQAEWHGPLPHRWVVAIRHRPAS